jgi:MFS family permease
MPWIVLAAGALMVAAALGALFSLAVFLEPMERAMGWSRSGLSAVGFVNWIVMGLGALTAGYCSDRFGTRRVVLVGGVLVGAGLVLSGQVTRLWQFYLTFGVLVAAGASAFLVPLTVTAMKWFGRRGALASALVSSGIGLGMMVFSPLSRWLINAFDWRTTFVVLGDLAWLIIIPLAFVVRGPRPGEVPGGEVVGPAETRSAAATPRSPSSAAVAGSRPLWHTWPFWAIAATHFGCCAAHSGPIFHMVSHALDLGVAKLAAASLLGVSGLASIASRVGTGMLADRFGEKRTLIGALALQAAAIFLYLFAADLVALTALGALFGVAYGGAMPLYPVVARAFFGEAALGTAYGAIFFVSCIGMGIGAWAGGPIHDALGSYSGLFIGSFLVGTAAVVLAVTLRPPARRSPALA